MYNVDDKSLSNFDIYATIIDTIDSKPESFSQDDVKKSYANFYSQITCMHSR